MKNKVFLFTILILLFFTPISLANLSNIKTIGSAEIEARSDILTISFNIIGENQNQSQLSRDFTNTINQIITKIAEENIVDRSDIEQKEGDIKNIRQNNRNIYKRTDKLIITSNKTDFHDDKKLINDFFTNIKKLDPDRQRVRYNVNTNISFSNYNIQLTISNKEELNQQLISQAITDSRQQAEAIANYLDFDTLNLEQIQTKESNTPLSFKKQLNPTNLKEVQLNHNFKLILAIKYLVN